MATPTKKYYTQNTSKMTVTVDFSVKPTAAEESIVKMLVAAGYKLVAKSEARTAKAKANAAKETIRSTKDIDLTKLTKEQQEEYKAILKGSGKGTGFFAARSYYKKIVK